MQRRGAPHPYAHFHGCYGAGNLAWHGFDSHGPLVLGLTDTTPPLSPFLRVPSPTVLASHPAGPTPTPNITSISTVLQFLHFVSQNPSSQAVCQTKEQKIAPPSQSVLRTLEGGLLLFNTEADTDVFVQEKTPLNPTPVLTTGTAFPCSRNGLKNLPELPPPTCANQHLPHQSTDCSPEHSGWIRRLSDDPTRMGLRSVAVDRV